MVRLPGIDLVIYLPSHGIGRYVGDELADIGKALEPGIRLSFRLLLSAGIGGVCTLGIEHRIHYRRI